jgi:hypothetical protein
MTDLLAIYQLTRGRLEQEAAGLTAEQLRWRPYPGALSIGEMALHVAGVELKYAAHITGRELDDTQLRLARCASEGVVDDSPFPITEAEIEPQTVSGALAMARAFAEPCLAEPTADMRAAEMQSVLGPTIDGSGVLARLAFHPAYHQGQAYSYRAHPGFPASQDEPEA